jgi:hypothetical protein
MTIASSLYRLYWHPRYRAAQQEVGGAVDQEQEAQRDNQYDTFAREDLSGTGIIRLLLSETASRPATSIQTLLMCLRPSLPPWRIP